MNCKRTLCFIAFLLCVCLLFSGCIQSNITMTVKKDRSMDISATYLVADYLANMTTDKSTTQNGVDKDSANWKSLQDRGYTMESVKKDGYTGFKATRHFHSIDDVSKESGVGVTLWKNTTGNFLDAGFDDTTFFSVKREFLKDTYTAHFFYDLSPEATGITKQEASEDLSAYLSEIEVTYTVTLPYKAIGHNATSVSSDGLTYTWKIPYGRPTAIDYTFTMPSRNILYCGIGAGALLLIAAVVVVVLLLIRKKRKNTAVAQPAQPAVPQPTQPAVPQPAQPAVPQPAQPAVPQPAQPAQPSAAKPVNVCPLCGGKLSVRIASSGPNVGAKYAVCEHYPATCKFARPIK